MPSKSNLHQLFTADELVTRGLKLYKQAKYEDALESLNAAEEAKNGGADLEILDIRAAIQTRSSDLDAALADARKMLVMDKAYVPGYLRTGRILESKERPDLALKIYERGIRYASRSHSRYGSLKKLYADLKQTIAPPDGINLFSILPVELLDMIFQYLPFEQVCKCLRVCQQWKQVLTSWPRFWFHVDLSAARREVKPTTLLKYIAYANEGVRSAVLNKVVLQANPILSKLTGKSQNLHSLSLLSGGALKDSLNQALGRAWNLKVLTLSDLVVITTETLAKCLESCPTLEEVTCDGLDASRQSLTLGPPAWKLPNYASLLSWSIKLRPSAIGPTDTTLAYLCPPATNLRSLGVSFAQIAYLISTHDVMQRCPSLQYLELHRTTLSQSPPVALPLQLRSLTAHVTGIGGGTPLGLLDVQNLVHLESLILLERGSGMNLDKVRRILAYDATKFAIVSQLHTLKLEAPLFDLAHVVELLSHPRLTELQHLGLVDCVVINDQLAAVIAGHGKRLKTLQIPNSKITGVGLKKLVLACPSLAAIDLNGCRDVSMDAVEWARQQGISVTWKMGV